MYRYHVFHANLSNSFILKINELFGSMVELIDLNEDKYNLRLSEDLNKSIEENEYPT